MRMMFTSELEMTMVINQTKTRGDMSDMATRIGRANLLGLTWRLLWLSVLSQPDVRYVNHATVSQSTGIFQCKSWNNSLRETIWIINVCIMRAKYNIKYPILPSFSSCHFCVVTLDVDTQRVSHDVHSNIPNMNMLFERMIQFSFAESKAIMCTAGCVYHTKGIDGSHHRLFV